MLRLPRRNTALAGCRQRDPPRWVNADDLGAPADQQQCRRLSDEILAEIDDTDAIQRAGHLTTPRSRA
jgi:hypothetical protein